jgi:Icc protein
MRLIQLSDTHIFNDTSGELLGQNTAKSFEAVLALLQAQETVSPDMLIITGDLSQDETDGAYRYIAKSLLPFKCPTYWIPGNHDAPDLMQKAFAQTHLKEDKAILWGKWLFILLNTHYPKHVPGLLGRTELSRLEYYLSQHPEQHTLIFMHHHPVPAGSKWLDNLGLKNAQDFFDIVDRHSQIRGIICGHIHQVLETQRQGVPILSAPSTSIQFKVNSEHFALDNLNPGYRWFELEPNGTFTTGVERVKNFESTVDFNSTGY